MYSQEHMEGNKPGAHAMMREASRISALESFGITPEAIDKMEKQRKAAKEARQKREMQLHGE